MRKEVLALYEDGGKLRVEGRKEKESFDAREPV